MNGWEIIECNASDFFAFRQIGNVCLGIERVPGGYMPTLSVDEYNDVVSMGTPMRTLDLAVESAESLVPLHMRAVCMSFRPFGEGADCVVEVADGV